MVQPPKTKYDVVVAGAGPAGTVVAYHLAGSGLRVAVFETRKWGDVWGKPCGDAIGLHHFENARLPYPPSDVVRNRVEGIDIYSPSLKVKYRVKGEGLIIDRRRLGQWLLNEASRRGVEVFVGGYTVMRPVIEKGRVAGVVVRQPNGETVEVRANVVVEATGVTRAIKRWLPREWSVYDELDPRDTNIAYREIWEYQDKVIDEPNVTRIYLNVNMAPGGYWWYFPEGETKVNLGLGVQGGMGYPNPKKLFEEELVQHEVVAGRHRVLEKGGAVVPTRRPSDSLVGPGIVVVGDAGYTVNPVHGGGIGYAFYSAYLAAKTILEAHEKGCYTEECLWGLNLEYMKTSGVKQAALDVFRRFLQRLSNEDIEFGMEKRLIPEADVYYVSSKGELKVGVVEKALIVLRGLRKPTLLLKLKIVADYMKKIRELYANYPEHPLQLGKWKMEVERLLREYEAKLAG